MRVTRLLLAAVLLSASQAAAAFEVGDWVLARYKGGPYYFSGVVKSLGDGSVTVLYDDQDQEKVPLAAVKDYDWRVGTKVECNFQGRGTWYPGTITKLVSKEYAVSIAYDDGDKEDTHTGRCRSK